MRFPWILTLALVAASMPANAQYKNKVAVKPSRQDKPAKSAPALNRPTAHNSGSQQLQKIEEQTIKTAAGPKSSARAHVAPVKIQHEKSNSSIHFASGTDGRGAGGGSAANSSKSRVRTKSSKH